MDPRRDAGGCAGVGQIMASGGIAADRLGEGVNAVRELHRTMHRRRVGRLRQLGFDDDAAEQISELHTANFM